MSIIHVEFFSSLLKREVSMKAIIPIEKLGVAVPEKKILKTLYLLHGYSGHCTDWLSGSSIHELSLMHDLAVIMPSGENSFYLDNPDTESFFGEFIGREVVGFTRALFPLSEKREDTCIGGFSMGGFGAIRNGLKYSDVFGSIIALSSALITDKLADPSTDFTKMLDTKNYYIRTFGNLSELSGSDRDPKALAEKAAENKEHFPNLYIACGTEDFLIEENRDYRDFLERLGVKFTYVETPGVHNWDFWNPQIKNALDWFDKVNA